MIGGRLGPAKSSEIIVNRGPIAAACDETPAQAVEPQWVGAGCSSSEIGRRLIRLGCISSWSDNASSRGGEPSGAHFYTALALQIVPVRHERIPPAG
jgi:hypothetical protein